ncbi:hypothetical protein ACROYT_G014348 [Oculina patagonica]
MKNCPMLTIDPGRCVPHATNQNTGTRFFPTKGMHGLGVYYDICCGEVYQRKPGKNDIIYIAYHIDGAPAVKSNGISCEPKKPDLRIFQDKFVNEIEEIQGGHVRVTTPGGEISVETVDVHGHPADLVAKAPSLCFSQYNGQNGCSESQHLDKSSDNGFLSTVNAKKVVDEAMLAVKFPHDFNRKLRALSELKRWKDRGLQNLLLPGSLPIVKTYFSPQYFYDFALFVTAISLLTADSVTDRDFNLAELLIRSYLRLMPSLYDETEETYTCHALIHLPDQVHKHGPLILHSSVVFEAMISHLKRQFHGTRAIIAQIVRNLLFAQNSGSLIERETKEQQEVKSFIEEHVITKKNKSLHQVEGHCSFHKSPIAASISDP